MQGQPSPTMSPSPQSGLYTFKPLSVQQQPLAAPSGVTVASAQPSGPMGGMELSNSGTHSTNGAQLSGGSGGGALAGQTSGPSTAQQLQGQSVHQLRALRGPSPHTPIQPSLAARAGAQSPTSMLHHHSQQFIGPSMAIGGGGGGGGQAGAMLQQINPSQLSTPSQTSSNASQMGPPTGLTAPGRMGGPVGSGIPSGQWTGRPGFGAVMPQRPSRYQQEPTDILSKQKLQELMRQVAPNDRLGPEVQELMQDIAEDFVESVTTFSCLLAKLRKSDCLDAKDVALHLERNWNIHVPGYSSMIAVTAPTPLSSLKRPLPEGHKQRLTLVKKTMSIQRKREERERERKQKEEKERKENQLPAAENHKVPQANDMEGPEAIEEEKLMEFPQQGTEMT